MDDQNQSKNQVRPKCREKAKKSYFCPDTQQKTKRNSIPSKIHNKTRKSHILGFLEKNCYFHFPKVLVITFYEGNGCAEVKDNNSNDTFVCDDDAHIVVLCTRSYFS